jgi:hypothetical protein
MLGQVMSGKDRLGEVRPCLAMFGHVKAVYVWPG